MTAAINIFTADFKLRFPFPREVRSNTPAPLSGYGEFNRSAHPAVPILMNGWEDDFRIGKFGKTPTFFVVMSCQSARITVRWMEQKHCLRYQHFCWVAADLLDYRK